MKKQIIINLFFKYIILLFENQKIKQYGIRLCSV